MSFVAAADPASKVASMFTSVSALHDAIQRLAFIPLRADGSPMVVQEFEGGYLLDGAPINVWIEDVWYDGQRELLEPYWQAGKIPRPELLDQMKTSVPLPPDVAANYEAYKAGQSAFGGIPTPVLIGGAVLAAFLLMRKP